MHNASFWLELDVQGDSIVDECWTDSTWASSDWLSTGARLIADNTHRVIAVVAIQFATESYLSLMNLDE